MKVNERVVSELERSPYCVIVPPLSRCTVRRFIRFLLFDSVNLLYRNLTPELSRDAQRPSGVLHDSATSEAAKRSRLERIVRRESACWIPCRRHDRREQNFQSFRELTAAGNCLPNGHDDLLCKARQAQFLEAKWASALNLPALVQETVEFARKTAADL